MGDWSNKGLAGKKRGDPRESEGDAATPGAEVGSSREPPPAGQGALWDGLPPWQRRCCAVTPVEPARSQPSRTCWEVFSSVPGKAAPEQVC